VRVSLYPRLLVPAYARIRISLYPHARVSLYLHILIPVYPCIRVSACVYEVEIVSCIRDKGTVRLCGTHTLYVEADSVSASQETSFTRATTPVLVPVVTLMSVIYHLSLTFNVTQTFHLLLDRP
jgi:hypothetical protein